MEQTPTDRLRAAWARTDDLFARLPDLQARPIALRHPFVFYLGHLPAFAWNQLGVAVLGQPSTGPWDDLFAFGIDPDCAEDAQAASIDCYPPVDEIEAWRDEIRARLLGLIPLLSDGDSVLHHRQRGVHLVVEHELMHHETLLYMVVHGGIAVADDWVGGDGAASEQVEVPAGEAVLGADFDALTFGWDNEFPAQRVDVPAFRIDNLPVRIADWQAYVAEGGPVPDSWVQRDGAWFVRSACGLVPLDEVRGWPVQVSQAQAAAYARARGRRLPTEAELARVRHVPDGANVGFRHWSPVPVGQASPSPSGVHEVVGNGWEHTASVFGPLPGFRAYVDSYAGYSADFFDEAHQVVVGGSWATDDSLLRPSFRNWYRADYPYVFSKFRTVAAG
jgi:formylglycine-generating enzyme required for sulfatase activity